MHALKEKFKEHLNEYEERVKKNPSTRFTPSEVQMVDSLASVVKNLCKIEMYDEYTDGESHDDEYSYRRGRMNAKRDSMGRYSRDDGYSNRGYSYASSKDGMLAKIEEMKRELERM